MHRERLKISGQVNAKLKVIVQKSSIHLEAHCVLAVKDSSNGANRSTFGYHKNI